jgi:hypothetical protein
VYYLILPVEVVSFIAKNFAINVSGKPLPFLKAYIPFEITRPIVNITQKDESSVEMLSIAQ